MIVLHESRGKMLSWSLKAEGAAPRVFFRLPVLFQPVPKLIHWLGRALWKHCMQPLWVRERVIEDGGPADADVLQGTLVLVHYGSIQPRKHAILVFCNLSEQRVLAIQTLHAP